MTDGPWLVDKSALPWLGVGPDAHGWRDRVSRGLVRITTVTLLEVGYSARNGPGWTDLVHGPPLDAMPVELQTPATEHRALELQGLLARLGQHRAPSVADLLVAATAELAGLVLLHRDKDFELVARVSGQAIERLGDSS